MTVDYKLIGERIKKRRGEIGITQERLAEGVSVSVGYISQIERGITKANLEMLSNICSFIDCDLIYLFGGAVAGDKPYLDAELVDRWARLNDSGKRMAIGILDILIDNQ